MAKRKPPKRPADTEIADLVDWLNEMSLRIFLTNGDAARRYTRIGHLLCELDHLKTKEKP
jgi:hypothetical protein